jgi:hypothetical protein
MAKGEKAEKQNEVLARFAIDGVELRVQYDAYTDRTNAYCGAELLVSGTRYDAFYYLGCAVARLAAERDRVLFGRQAHDDAVLKAVAEAFAKAVLVPVSD